MKPAEAKQRITELEAEVAKQSAAAENARKLWHAQLEKNGKAIGDSMERLKLEKILSIISHITAGRANEAIQDLLEPLPMVIALDIRFADDDSRQKAEEELLERLKTVAIDTIKGTTIRREPSPPALK